jgi:hypothetical protein
MHVGVDVQIHVWEDTIKKNLKDTGYKIVDWVQLALHLR